MSQAAAAGSGLQGMIGCTQEAMSKSMNSRTFSRGDSVVVTQPVGEGHGRQVAATPRPR